MITCFRHYDILAETRTQSSLMKSGKCAQGFPLFFLPSLDATRTRLNLPKGTSLILAKTRSRMTTLTICKIKHHVFTTSGARIQNLKRKNKNVLKVLKYSIYISLF